MSLLRSLLVAGTIFLAGSSSAVAQKRVALVMGNGAYQEVAALPNPPRDASDIADSLQRLGFTVTRLMDGDATTMRKALVSFGQSTYGSEMAIVYYAGHGMEIGGENWLIPVDAKLSSDTDIESEAVSLRTVTLQVAKARQLGLVILDACRNNPFAKKMQRSIATRAVTRGLAPTEPTDNVLVAYSAKDGTTAEDGSGRNSPFTAALLRNIEAPGLEVTFLFRIVRDEVMASTKREQQPFVYGSLSSEAIYLKPPSGNADVKISQQAAAQAWAAIKESSSTDAIESFIRYYGEGFYGDLARARLAELKRPAVIASLPPSRDLSTSRGTDARVQFGGPPYCKYMVTLKNPKLSAPLDKPGAIDGATLSMTMVEDTVPPCSLLPIGTKLHTYTGSGTYDNNGSVVLSFSADPTNSPRASATFTGKVNGGRLVGSLTIQRIDIGGNLAWRVVSQFQ